MCMAIYDVWKWSNRLTLGLNVAENTNYMKKILELNSISPQSGDKGLQR